LRSFIILSNSLCLESFCFSTFVDCLAFVDLNVSFSFLKVSFNSDTADPADATFLVNQTGENLNNIIRDIIKSEKNINQTADFPTNGSNIKNILNTAE
jgi:hypothetical protein